MRLCTLRIGIHFLKDKDPGFRALVGLRDPFDDLFGLSCRSERIILSTEANLCLLVNGGVTIILFVVTNPVCVPKKRNLSIFRGLKGAWKHIRTLEWKWKRDGTPVPSEMVRSLAQKKGLIRIILTWFCFLYYFNNTGSGSSPTRIE
ncbi:hypothetical protein QVD17_42520 [Tagetes erecta]|uniref:Uncharacterized protein n=1 Tax=Tagetes erecta TaxID=13708 RepID=A0AAD8NDE2_TARER|nr:hypothetical protein QVD17_42520 [Tagetes erecta]